MADFFEMEGQRSMLPTLRELLARLFRQRRVVVLCFLGVIALCALTGQYKAKYRASMVILVRKERVDPVLTPGQNSTPLMQQPVVTDEELNSEVELLRSYDLLQQTVLDAGLAPAGTANPVALAKAVRRLQNDLEVSALAKTNLIAIAYTTGNPEVAQRVLACLRELYLKKHQQLHGSTGTLTFFDGQIREHGAALQAAEARLRNFTGATGIVSASLERDIAVQQMGNMAALQMTNEADLASADSRTNELRSELQKTAARITTAVQSKDNLQLLSELQSRLVALRLKRAELLAKYDPGYRLVGDVNAQIAIVEQALESQMAHPAGDSTSDVNPVVSQLQENLAQSEADSKALRARQVDLLRFSADLKKQAAELQAQSLTQQDLLRNVKTEQDQLQLYIDKREEARMAVSLDRDGILNVVVVQSPSVPALPEHSLPFMLAVTFLSALILSLGAAFIGDMFDPTVHTGSEIEEILHIPLVEEIDRSRTYHTARGAA